MPTILKTKRRPWQPERTVQARRINANSEFYRSTVWRKLRAHKLHINPICEECNKHGRITPAVMVDHITPINKGGGRLDMGNLQSMCNHCHNIKSGKEAHL